MSKATKETAIGFVLNCMNQLESAGYQELEDETGNVPDGTTPDEFWHDGNVIGLRFGDRVFHVTVSIPRKQEAK